MVKPINPVPAVEKWKNHIFCSACDFRGYRQCIHPDRPGVWVAVPCQYCRPEDYKDYLLENPVAEVREPKSANTKGPPTVPEILEASAATFRERNAVYNDNYKHHGECLLVIFGGKIPEIKTSEEGDRFGLVNMLVAKLFRYCQSFEKGGHEDSAHDMIVYAAMLEELTKNVQRN